MLAGLRRPLRLLAVSWVVAASATICLWAWGDGPEVTIETATGAAPGTLVVASTPPYGSPMWRLGIRAGLPVHEESADGLGTAFWLIEFPDGSTMGTGRRFLPIHQELPIQVLALTATGVALLVVAPSAGWLLLILAAALATSTIELAASPPLTWVVWALPGMLAGAWVVERSELDRRRSLLAWLSVVLLAMLPSMVVLTVWPQSFSDADTAARAMGIIIGSGVAGAVVLSAVRRVLAAGEREPSSPLGARIADELLPGRAAARASAAAAERSRLASDIHADVLPALRSAMAASSAGVSPAILQQRLQDLEHEVDGILADRRLIVLEELGLVEALEWLAERTQERDGVTIVVTVADRSDDRRPPGSVERAAFAVAKLALENAVRHARPATVRVDVRVEATNVLLRVVDDGTWAGSGRGRQPRSRGQGLVDMHVEAAQVRATVEVARPDSGGTVVKFEWAYS